MTSLELVQSLYSSHHRELEKCPKQSLSSSGLFFSLHKTTLNSSYIICAVFRQDYFHRFNFLPPDSQNTPWAEFIKSLCSGVGTLGSHSSFLHTSLTGDAIKIAGPYHFKPSACHERFLREFPQANIPRNRESILTVNILNNHMEY